jgi:hypothetical protein
VAALEAHLPCEMFSALVAAVAGVAVTLPESPVELAGTEQTAAAAAEIPLRQAVRAAVLLHFLVVLVRPLTIFVVVVAVE